MKSLTIQFFIAIIVAMLSDISNSYSQSTSSDPAQPAPAANMPFGATDYNGWATGASATLAIPELTIQNEDAMSISFYTNAGTGFSLANMRMWIKDDGGATQNSNFKPNDGFVGIGDFSSATGTAGTPQSHLHLMNSTADDNWFQITTAGTGHDLSHGMQIGVIDNTKEVQIRQQEDAPLTIWQGDNTGNTPAFYMYERMRIIGAPGYDHTTGTLPYCTKVMINHGGDFTNTFVTPVSMLNIGEEITPPPSSGTYGGYRPWMEVGTFDNYDSDNMYTGLKDEGSDRDDAVIEWGDNLNLPNAESGPQNLRFIFTAVGNSATAYSTSPSESINGLEIARMNSLGNMGIGDFYKNGYAAAGHIEEPIRRLEILDAKNIFSSYPTISLNNPQLRLTFTQATAGNTLTTGIWTDFQTTSLGDLCIHPDSATINRRVGINTSTPQRTLEINSNDTPVSPASGNSGLRLTDLTTASTPITPNPFGAATPAVLSVNASGDVVLVPDAGAVCNTTNNLVQKNSSGSLACSIIYDNGTNVGIGTTSPSFRFDVQGGGINTSLDYSIGGITVLSVRGGNNNTFVGHYSGITNTTGSYNTANGFNSLHDNTSGNSNTASGISALYKNTTGGNNTANGAGALYNNTTGSNNIANGSGALYSNLTGINNTANGFNTLYSNNTGSYNTANGLYALTANTTGDNNSANGSHALYTNTTGSSNTANGRNALYTNSTGNYNCANGKDALYNNTATGNTADGYRALYTNSSGYYNVASGYLVLESNTTGYYNTASGGNALNSNTTGDENTAGGGNSLLYNTTGDENTAVGKAAYYANTTGSNNTALGFNAGTGSGGNYSNSMALGNSAPVTASNQVNVGNTSILTIQGQVGFTTYPSDSRFKKNVQENVKGLDFIKLLRPVTYNVKVNELAAYFKEDTRVDSAGNIITITPDQFTIDSRNAKSNIVYSGFIAQEVEASAQSIGYAFSGVDAPQNANGLYGLRYAEFVVPLVKSVQELNVKNSLLETRVLELEQNLAICCIQPRPNGDAGTNKATIELENIASLILFEADPNPFSESTTIRFNIPTDFKNAIMYFYDNSGNRINTYEIKSKGQGELQVFGSKLSSGIYTYTLVIDGKVIDSKKMLKAK